METYILVNNASGVDQNKVVPKCGHYDKNTSILP